jgi:glycosyltransferase involved in cell wall biosynthesis
MDLIVDGIIYYYQKYGGISRIFTEVLPQLCNLEPDLNISLLTHPQGSSENLPEHSQIILHSLPNFFRYFRPHRLWNPYYPLLSQLAARSILGCSKGKIWLSTYYTSPICWEGPKVVFVHDFIFEKFRLSYWLNDLSQIDIWIRNKAVAIAGATRNDLFDIYDGPRHKTSVVYLAPKPLFTLLDGVQKSFQGKFILYVGARGHYKDFDTFLRTYAVWPGRFDIELICVGGGKWTEQERQFIVQYGLSNRISLLHHVNDQDLCQLYNEALAFINSSKYEGFGLPLLEAMACGCPIVASRIPSSVEVARDIPFYFTPGNIEELIVALDQVVAKGRTLSRTEEGLALTRQFSWKNTAGKILKIFRSLD